MASVAVFVDDAVRGALSGVHPDFVAACQAQGAREGRRT